MNPSLLQTLCEHAAGNLRLHIPVQHFKAAGLPEDLEFDGLIMCK